MAVFATDAPRAPSRPPTNGICKRDRDRAERLRLAGGRKPSLRERAVTLAREKGEVRTKDLTDIGVHRCYLAKMCDEGLLIKVGYVDRQVSARGYGTSSEYVLELIRMDQDRQQLRSLVLEGAASAPGAAVDAAHFEGLRSRIRDHSAE